MTQDSGPKHPSDVPHISIEGAANDICIDASVLGRLFGLPPQDVPQLMRTRALTGVCEQGVDADAGTYRLNFFYQNRRARLKIDTAGRIFHSSVIDFGDRLRKRSPF